MLKLRTLHVAVLALNYVAGTALVYQAYAAHPDHSGTATAQWVLLYLFGVVYPAGWVLVSRRTQRGGGASDEVSWAPVIAGTTTLLVALSLIDRLGA